MLLISGIAPQLPSLQARNPSVSHTPLPHLSIFTDNNHQLLSLLLPLQLLNLPILLPSITPPARSPTPICSLQARFLQPMTCSLLNPYISWPHLLLKIFARLPIVLKIKSKLLRVAFKALQILGLRQP